MIEETVFTAHSSALRVWTLLADLSGYARWHPQYRFSNGPARSEKSVLSWLLFDDRRVKFLVHVDSGDKPQKIGWRGGRKGLVTLREHYEIKPIANGAEVRHIFDCRGVVGTLFVLLTRNSIREDMIAQDSAFLAHLKKQSRKSIPDKGYRAAAPSRYLYAAAPMIEVVRPAYCGHSG
ncbi:SRPBCC family protein [Tardiphaga sp.]|uniref:SRPBCC family protein n=1 Tax=Tardiphaga sp. TaxID=1926292 RepID=UPI00352BBCE5